MPEGAELASLIVENRSSDALPHLYEVRAVGERSCEGSVEWLELSAGQIALRPGTLLDGLGSVFIIT